MILASARRAVSDLWIPAIESSKSSWRPCSLQFTRSFRSILYFFRVARAPPAPRRLPGHGGAPVFDLLDQ
jgi:hypothetical protein